MRNLEKLFFPRAETQEQQPMYASWANMVSAALTVLGRLFANTSSKLLRHQSELLNPPEYTCGLLLVRYGWFWECPNGENCHYRHALPPGFMLKSQRKAMEEAEKANQISLEEFLEVEVRSSNTYIILKIIYTLPQRHKLGSNLTPVTPETFAKWKQTRMNKKQAEEEALRKTKDAQAAAGKSNGMSGRDLVRLHGFRIAVHIAHRFFLVHV